MAGRQGALDAELAASVRGLRLIAKRREGGADVFVVQNWELVTEVKLRYSAATRRRGNK